MRSLFIPLLLFALPVIGGEPVDFEKEVKPLALKETRCVSVDSMKRLFKKGGPFNHRERAQLQLWADQGFNWMDDEWALNGYFVGRDSILEDGIFLVREMRKDIIKKSTVTQERDMRNYQSIVPKNGNEYRMVAIKGGEFLMGSPAGEKHRNKDEGPQRKVKIEPFWMGKYEVTWELFESFLINGQARNRDGSPEWIPDDASAVDIVSSPTAPYMDLSFGMGWEGFPAVCMTQHAASKFCQWLSAQTGHFYRLPTEAEWEYACRAGTTTAYHFGDDPKKLHEYGWYWSDTGDESEDKYHQVGTKKPNQWGLYDMHGNVFEWCLDQYYPDAYRSGVATIPATKLYPRVFRGGSWYDGPELSRSAARFFSDPEYKMLDPMMPKSLWILPDALWLGFRIVRPLKVPPAEEMEAIWNSGEILDMTR